MNILFMLSCQDLYSYDEKNITVNWREITTLDEAASYKKNRLKYLGIQTSWEQGIFFRIDSGKPIETQVVWDQKVPLKVKIVLNEKALELKKNSSKKATTWQDNPFAHAVFQPGLQIAQTGQMPPQAQGQLDNPVPVPNAGQI